jgi:hypothetical protein
MGKYLVVYKGGQMGATPEAVEATMAKWMEWFGSMGSAVTDFGNPLGASTAIGADGSHGDATSELSGYSIIEADDLDAAATMAQDCPVLANGGALEIYEAMPM